MIAESEDNMVYIVGIGPGNREYMLSKAISVLEDADIIIGFKRAIESISFIRKYKIIANNLNDILNFVKVNEDKNVAIIGSGDPLFYGIGEYIKKNYEGNISIVPGISSFQYMMGKLGKAWQGAHLGSLHGREEDFIKEVKDNKMSIWLTDNKNTPQVMCRKLNKAELNVMMYIGENLSYEDEKISFGEQNEFIDKKFSDLTVVVIDNDYKG
ncbi:precorrin-6y C5,15-methyltransferase (decarboxylating) subunit CbiE [Clostridium akagii]|uniref:precorrin-6y C5,15-methyltransferase (decarboxylating) subunit CbiE n=1 Tax=Clostridium akagii TaxID=91623 RepID=UPI000AFA419C|nr:precorrin-6y C5,15-methyltransferase (decarboxylating) subunit CbiE [Clostridium akagii]